MAAMMSRRAGGEDVRRARFRTNPVTGAAAAARIGVVA